jgi:hypothetical protein
MPTTMRNFGPWLRNMSLGVLAAFAIVAGAAHARANDAAERSDIEHNSCVAQAEPPQAVTATACENSCRALWQTLVRECQRLTGSAKGQCLSDAREDYDACLARC